MFSCDLPLSQGFCKQEPHFCFKRMMPRLASFDELERIDGWARESGGDWQDGVHLHRNSGVVLLQRLAQGREIMAVFGH